MARKPVQPLRQIKSGDALLAHHFQHSTQKSQCNGKRVFSRLVALPLAYLVFTAGCAAPGEPVPPHAPIPQAVTDLSAHQEGTFVVLTFTLPTKTMDGDALGKPPDVEVYREIQSLKGEATAPWTLVDTITGPVLSSYSSQGEFRFKDALHTDDYAQSAKGRFVYTVRTGFSAEHLSAQSNAVALQVFAPAKPPSDFSATVTKKAIALKWMPATQTVTGEPIAISGGFRVYRAEVAENSAAVAVANPQRAALIAPLAIIGVARQPEYDDTTFEFGRTYVYAVRSVAEYPSILVESDDSGWIGVSPVDTFPPSAPTGLEAIVVPPSEDLGAHVELSWAINPETDVAGYNIYRSEGASGVGQRLNSSLLPTPVFRDISAVSGHTYMYRVTAVSRAEVEGAPSGKISVTLQAESSPSNP